MIIRLKGLAGSWLQLFQLDSMCKVRLGRQLVEADRQQSASPFHVEPAQQPKAGNKGSLYGLNTTSALLILLSKPETPLSARIAIGHTRRIHYGAFGYLQVLAGLVPRALKCHHVGVEPGCGDDEQLQTVQTSLPTPACWCAGVHPKSPIRPIYKPNLWAQALRERAWCSECSGSDRPQLSKAQNTGEPVAVGIGTIVAAWADGLASRRAAGLRCCAKPGCGEDHLLGRRVAGVKGAGDNSGTTNATSASHTQRMLAENMNSRDPR